MNKKEFIKKFIPKWVLSLYHYKLALLGAFLYGFPGIDKSIKIIGVTGTSGKSTTCDLITKILEEAGNKVASISTIRFKIGDREWENKYKMTMPGRFVIQKFLRQAKNAGCKYIVLEVTSEGIRQFRHKFINFDTAIFTNLTPEHIESHGGFENYRNAKLKLFRATKNIHIINADDENSKYFLAIPAKKNYEFGLKKPTEQFYRIVPGDIQATDDGILFKIQDTEFKISLLGQFNVYNAIAAISVARAYGINLETCKKALEKAKGITGRMEVVVKNPFQVIVDYAHTPEQLENVYKTFSKNPREIGSHTKLICVLGSCGGGRDKWKRPVLGKIASKYCDQIIITNEDPYDENPLSIMEEIKSGFSQIPNPNPQIPNDFQNPNFKYQKILDRKKAIEKAIYLAKPGDVVIITGKGSEPWMCVENNKKIPWDDRQIARDAVIPKTLDKMSE